MIRPVKTIGIPQRPVAVAADHLFAASRSVLGANGTGRRVVMVSALKANALGVNPVWIAAAAGKGRAKGQHYGRPR